MRTRCVSADRQGMWQSWGLSFLEPALAAACQCSSLPAGLPSGVAAVSALHATLAVEAHYTAARSSWQATLPDAVLPSLPSLLLLLSQILVQKQLFVVCDGLAPHSSLAAARSAITN